MAEKTPMIDRLALEQEFGGFTPPSLGPGLPNIPFVGVPNPASVGLNQNEVVSLEAWQNRLKQPSGIPIDKGAKRYSIAEGTSPRFDFYDPLYDNEDAAARGQSYGSTVVNALGKGLALTGTTFLQSTIGMVNGLIQWRNTGRAASFYDNEFNRYLDQINKDLEDKLPNYYTNAERDLNWYSPSKLFSKNFFWDGIIKNMGFAAGAALSGAAYTSVLRAIPLTSRLFSIGKAAQTLAATEEGLLAADKAASTYGKIKSLSDTFLKEYNLLNPAGRAVVAGLATSGEAGFEAYHNLNDTRNKLIEEYKQENGVDPSGLALEKINKTAEDAGNLSFALNTILLTATNYIQFPKIIGSTYKGEKGIISSTIRQTNEMIEDAGQLIAASSKRSGILNALNKVRPYTFSISEGFEEGSQYAISRATDDYFNKKYANDENANFFDSLITGVKETVTTNEGMENILIGGLSGALMQARGTYREQREKGKNTVQAIEAINKTKLSDFTKETFDAVNRGVAIQEDREELVTQGKILDAKDKEADYIINYLTPRIKYGRFDLVADEIEQYRRLIATSEGFNQLKAEGKILETDTPEGVAKRLDILQSMAENVKSLYQSLTLRYGDIKDEQGELVYSNTVMDKMIYAASKVVDYDRRLMELQASIPSTTIDINSAIKDNINGDSSKFEEIVYEIINMDILEEKKVEMIEAVEDYAKISYRRDGFLKEYSKIKLNPKAYDSLPQVSTDAGDDEQDKNLIKITTSTGEREIRIGEEYVLGKTIKYDEKGNEVIELPIFKVLGVNEDGTIRVKTTSGERNVDPEYFEEYKVSSLKNINKRPLAKFYMRNVNTIVFKNLGGKKGGKRPGRLLYFAEERNAAGEITSPEKLFLVYKNPKGKVVDEEITLSMFQPKPGTKYKQGILTLGKKLTAQDEADILEREKADEERNRAIRADRVSILSQMFDEISNQQDDIAKLIEEKKSKIDAIDADLATMRQTIESDQGDKRTKSFKFKKAASVALQASIDLMRMRQQLAEEIEVLEAQRDDLEYEMAMISDAEQNIDELPFDNDELVDELSDQVNLLEGTILDLGKQINDLSALYDSTEKALKSAIKFLKDLVSDFSNKFKGTPLMNIRSQEFLDYVKSLRETLDPFNYSLALQKLEVYKKDIAELDKIVGDIEDTEITPNEKLLEELSNEIQELQSRVNDLAKEKEIKAKIRDRYQKLFLEAEEKKLELERISKDKLLIEEAIGTKDKGQRTGVFDIKKKFEQAYKKAVEILIRSTSPITKEAREHHIRANNFGVRLNSFENRSAIKGVYVTATTEEKLGLKGLMEKLRTDDNGIVNESIDTKTTIALVMVEEAPDGSFILVDEFGNPIPKDTSPKDAINLAIYQTYPLADLKWLNGDTMFREQDAKDEDFVEDIKKQYADWRKSVLDSQTLEAHEIDSSFGFLEYKRDEDGQIDYDTRTSPIDAGLITQEDLETSPVVFVSTTTDEISKGTTSFTNTLGRVFLSLKNAYVKLNNRRLTKSEGEVIFKVLVQLSKNIIDPKIGVKNPKSTALLKFLKSMVYWGIPETIEGERKEDGYNSIYFEKAKNGSLHLHISGLGKTFLFTPTELNKNKSEILTYLSALHNDVKSHMIKNINEKYEQIVDIDESGEIVSVTWPNYQTFLLSPVDPDGKKRKDELPLSTIAVPVSEQKPINRYGVYFYTTDTVDDFVIKERKKPGAKVTSVPVITGAPQSNRPVPFASKDQPWNIFTTDRGSKISYHFPADLLQKGDPNLIIIGPDSFPILDKGAANLGITRAEMAAKIKPLIFNEIKNAYSQPSAPSGGSANDYGIKITGFPSAEEVPTEYLPSIEEEQPDYGVKITGFPSAEETTSTEKTDVEKIDPGIDELLRQNDDISDESDDEVYRQVSKEYQEDEVETEDWDKIEQWFKKNLPMVPIYRVMNILKGKNGLQAWGMFKRASVYIYKNAEIGTAYHEAFEAVWGMFTTAKERAEIISEFRRRKGSFVDHVSGKTIKYSDATDLEAKEQMAEEFRDYILYGKSPITPEPVISSIKKFFIHLWRTIKQLFGGKKPISELEKLFEKINTGGFRDVVPTGASQILDNSRIIDIENGVITDDAQLRPVPGISDKKRAEIIQHMTFLMLREIVKTDSSLFTIPENISKGDIYDKLKGDVLRSINRRIEAIKKLGKDKIIGEDRVAREINPLVNLMNNVFKQWESIVSDHQDYIRAYNIEFDEFDETLRKSDERTRETDDYVNSNKIDHFKKANSAIKLLLSTIPIVRQDNPSKIKPSSINGAILIPMSNVYITIMNAVHDATGLDDMLAKLKKLAIKDVNYRSLYKRLSRDYDFGSPTPTIGEIKNDYHLQLLSSFYSVFKKARPEVDIFTVMRNGESFVGQAYLSSIANQLRNEFVSNIVNNAQQGKGYLIPDKKNKKFIGSADKAKNVNAQSRDEILKFLNTLGIDFSAKEYNLLSSVDKEKLAEEARGILKFIREGKEIVSVNKKSLDISGRLMKIAELKAKITTQDFSSTFFGVDRERKQSYIGTNPITDLQDFIYSLFRFNYESVGGTVYRYLFDDPFSKGSVILSRMFSSSGFRKQGNDVDDLLRVGYVDGMDDQTKNKRKSSDRLNYIERLVQEINLNIEGKYLNLVPGDASIEWFVKMGNHVSLAEASKGVDSYIGIFLNYLESEIEVARQKKKNLPKVEGRKNTDLRFMKMFFSEQSMSEMVNSKEPANIVASNPKYVNELKRNLALEIVSQREALKEELTRTRVLQVTEAGDYNMNKVNLPQGMSMVQVENNLDYLTVNYMIANVEFHKIYYGDPYQYKDELKRIKNFNSPRQSIISNSSEFNRALHNIYNRDYPIGDIGHSNLLRNYFTTATMNDVISIDESLNYSEFEETDGSGIINFKAYRNLRIRAAKWNDAEERQFKYDIAFEKQIKGANLSQQEKVEKGLVLSEKELQILQAGNPKVKSAYTPLKPIVSGNKLDKDGNPRETNDVILDKYALYPLSFRVAYEMNSESNQIGLYNKMINEDIDYVVFNSGRKVGAEKSINPYKDGKITTEKFFQVNIPMSAVAIQTEVPSKDDNKVSRGTQPTKLVTMDLMDAGVPVDYDTKETDIEKRLLSWNSLSEERKIQKSKLYKEIINNRKLLTTMFEIGHEKLIKQLGIVKTSKGYEINDISKTAKILREELLKREMSDNIHMALDSFLDEKSVIEATPAYSQIRNIIYSIIDREVNSQKMPGGMKVQIPSTFFETRREKINGKDAYVSDYLKFYVDKDGERVMEVMVGRWFESSKTDKELIEYFNTKEGQEILSGVAYRIPTQKQNSIDRFVIKKFLPYEFGDSVVIPSQLVKKTGSDFDIDKLTMYFRNLRTKTKNGYPVAYKLMDDSNSTVEERYTEWVNDIADKETKRFVTTLANSELKNVKEEYKEKNKALKQQLTTSISYVKDSLYNDYVSGLESGIAEIQRQFVNDYLLPLMNVGSEIFRKLPDYIKDSYFQMRKDMALRNVNGPVEFENYMALTIQLKESGLYPEASSIFDDLVDNYEEILRIFGLGKDYIDEYKNQSLENFRNTKTLTIEQKLSQYNEIRDNMREQKKVNMSQFEFDKAVQIARLDKLESLEEFSKRSIEKQNILKALQNEYITSLENLISSKENFKAMTSPNTATKLKSLADVIAKKVKKGTFDYSKVDNMLNRQFMSSLRHAFTTGKYAIGIAAINQTNQALSQMSNIGVSTKNYNKLTIEDQYFLTMGTFDPNHLQPKFKQINKTTKNGELVTSLSRIKDAKNQYEIADILSQFIDGYVDISKGPWIMQMSADPTVASIFMILVKMGVPVDQVVYFMNQPIIQGYLEMIQSYGYTWKYIPDFIEGMMMDYSSSTGITIDPNNFVPSATALNSTLGKDISELTDQELTQQRFMLMEFLKMARMADQLFLVMQGSNYDTANFNDGYLLFKKGMQQLLAMNTIIDDVEDILENSFIGPLAEMMLEAREAASAILKSDQYSVRSVIQKVLTPFVKDNDQDFVKTSQLAVANLFDWAVQNDQKLNESIKNIMIENGGVATRITKFVNEVRNNSQHPLHENLVIKLIQPLLASDLNEDKVNVVKIKALENKAYDQNNLIFAFRELREYLDSINSNLYDQLKKLAILQSGLTRSSISFTSVLPFEDFEAIYNPTLSKLNSLNLDAFYKLDVFYRNNWSNSDIVPTDYARAFKSGNKTMYNVGMRLNQELNDLIKAGSIPQLLTRPINGKQDSDFLNYYWEDNISEREKNAMKRKGDTSYMHRGLFKIVRHANGDPLIQLYTVQSGPNKGQIRQNYVYKAINAWGDGQYANEYYNTIQPSVINNGMLKVKNEVADSVIVELFEGKQPKKNVNSQNKPGGLPAIDRSPKSCN